jgi:diaminohydroxyphosphoribosylaminopyrimidine deaminase/5-amino-6-(5-phosphoribosylamino)uracil reductase
MGQLAGDDPGRGLPPASDDDLMGRALARAAHARLVAPPNPWVGAVVVTPQGTAFEGFTQRPGGPHAERLALQRAGGRAAGATLYVTLEPCSHHGRTPPCVGAVLDAGVARVVVALEDPDRRVAGRGIAALRAAGVEVVVGVGASAAARQLEPYLHHRRTGRPFVVLKWAATLDGRTAAPDGTSQWITGPEARADVQRLRAESDAICVGAATVRSDDPRLTVRGLTAPDGEPPREPVRVVLGRAPAGARVHPCVELSGDLGPVLDRLGSEGVVQLLVEGGATVAGRFHRQGLVDRYVVYLAPALAGGDDGRPVFAGPGAPAVDQLWRGRIERIVRLGPDLRVDLRPGHTGDDQPSTTEDLG